MVAIESAVILIAAAALAVAIAAWVIAIDLRKIAKRISGSQLTRIWRQHCIENKLMPIINEHIDAKLKDEGTRSQLQTAVWDGIIAEIGGEGDRSHLRERGPS